MFQRVKIQSDQIGLMFRDGQFEKRLNAGVYWFFDPFVQIRVELVSLRQPVFTHAKIRDIIKSKSVEGIGNVLDLKDWERALIWVDGRFYRVLMPGSYVLWNAMTQVRIEVVDARNVTFDHDELVAISQLAESEALQLQSVSRDQAGVLFIDGKYHSTLTPGRYAFWRKIAEAIVVCVDLREQAIDVNGQDLITSDKVTLRLNAVVTFQVADAKRSLSSSDNVHQALYRATQLALRAIVGQHPLDEFLDNKHQIADQALTQLKDRANELGLSIISVGVRDVILPGDMKELMNKVIEAKKAAEANLIFRREETAAMRSQANTAKLLDSHPTLMRLRELEVLEKVAESSNLKVVLGDDQGLSERLRRLV